MRVHACAVGQAAAAIFAGAAVGRNQPEIEQALAQMAAWVAGEGAIPDWPGIEAIAAASAYPARHGAMLLPWQAAQAALCSAPSND
jgi:NifU-like protein involved in Fe-S cluster formation